MILFLMLCISFQSTTLSSKGVVDIFYAIRVVESHDDDSVRDGDGGLAIGVYQIHKSYWRDAIEFSNIGGVYGDCRDRAYAKRIVILYMRRYATSKRLGREPTIQDVARIHNGGPNGYKKKSTIKYWCKIRGVLVGTQQ